MDQSYESSAIVEWAASIEYGPDVEWGIPEQEFEAALLEKEIELTGMDSGTDLTTDRRDFTWYFNATHDEAEAIRKRFDDWTIAPVG